MSAYSKQRIPGESNIELEHKLFGADHTQLAGYLLHLWNFPYSLIETVVSHHSPQKLLTEEFTPAAAIYAASQLLSVGYVDENFVEHFKLKDKIPKWKDMAKELKPT